jgi:hypothetical protein
MIEFEKFLSSRLLFILLLLSRLKISILFFESTLEGVCFLVKNPFDLVSVFDSLFVVFTISSLSLFESISCFLGKQQRL